MSILNLFPYNKYKTIRTEQKRALLSLEQCDNKYVVLQAPVASGKSAIAITYVSSFESGYVVTPRKMLQDQYNEDFPEVPMFKGKSSYVCSNPRIRKGVSTVANCSNCGAHAADKSAISKFYITGEGSVDGVKNKGCRTCPYYSALGVSNKAPYTICNLHSLYFNSVVVERLPKKDVLIIDEAHDLPEMLREQATIKFVFHEEPHINDCVTAEDYIVALESYVVVEAKMRFIELVSGNADADDDELRYVNNGDEPGFIDYKVSQLKGIEFIGKFVVDMTELDKVHIVRFIPLNIAKIAQDFFSKVADKIVFMSGTIYSPSAFAKDLGIGADEVDLVSINNVIPAVKRPIFAKDEYMVDCSYKAWNVDKVCEKINQIVNIPKLQNVKGIIHASSYAMAKELAERLGERFWTHTSADFDANLNFFKQAKTNKIFITPSCSQGVDFKDDLARFQIIVRLPYPNASDEFFKYMYENNFPFVNRHTLVTLGQQLGRVNRHENDAGVTFLLDSRFKAFLEKNKKILPKYVMDAVIK